MTKHDISITFFHSILVGFMRPKYEYRPPDPDTSPFSDFNSDESSKIKC